MSAFEACTGGIQGIGLGKGSHFEVEDAWLPWRFAFALLDAVEIVF